MTQGRYTLQATFDGRQLFAIDENPFKQEKRDYPIDFKYPIHDSYTITYNIPQGYVVESIPEKIENFREKIGEIKKGVK